MQELTAGAGMDYRDFGKVISRIRKEKGVTQVELSHAAGCDRSFVSMVERGVCIPTLRTMNEMCTALGWKVYQVIEIVENSEKVTA